MFCDPTLPDLVVSGPQNILFPERPNKYFIIYKVSKKKTTKSNKRWTKVMSIAQSCCQETVEIHESRDTLSSNEMQANMTRLVYY